MLFYVTCTHTHTYASASMVYHYPATTILASTSIELSGPNATTKKLNLLLRPNVEPLSLVVKTFWSFLGPAQYSLIK